MKRGESKTIKGESYRVALFLVTSRKADGTPNECRRIADDETIKVEEGMEFITAFVPEKVLRRTAN